MRWLFHPFETWLDPFKAPPSATLPDQPGRFLLYFIRQSRWPLFMLLGLSATTGLIEAWLYASVGILVDTLRDADRATVWSEHGTMFLVMAAVVLILRTLSMGLTSVVSEQTIVPGLFYMTRWQSHQRVIRQSYAFFQDDFAGRVATKVMQSGQAVGDFLIDLIQGVLQFVIFGIVTIGLFATVDWRLALLLTGWFAGYFALLYLTLGEIRQRSRVMAQRRATVNGRLVDSYTNIQTVKLFAGTEREDRFIRSGIEDNLDAVRALGRYVSGLRFCLVALNGILMVGAGWLCITLWQWNEITLGALAASLGLVLRLNHMSGWISFMISGLFRNLGNIQDSIDTVSQPIKIVDRPEAPDLNPSAGPVVLDRVTFAYGGTLPALRDLSLTVAPGEKIGLVGPSGAGKTTIVSLLLRLYDIQSGHIRLGGHDIAAVSQESLRRNIGVVTQDTSLLHRSVFDNIAYGRPNATRDQVVEAARRARAHEFILDLEDVNGRSGYDAHVGERGVKLSGGQRQRIAIARIFLKDAPILILDEATSALDSEVEAAIQEQLMELMEGKTVIAIAHRLSTIAVMDRLVVMEQGRILETGTHDELLRTGGLYAGLWTRQSGGFLSVDRQSGEAAE